MSGRYGKRAKRKRRTDSNVQLLDILQGSIGYLSGQLITVRYSTWIQQLAEYTNEHSLGIYGFLPIVNQTLILLNLQICTDVAHHLSSFPRLRGNLPFKFRFILSRSAGLFGRPDRQPFVYKQVRSVPHDRK
jgi:hypothetical protein